MATLEITAGNVVRSTGYKQDVGTAGEAITAGMPVYKYSSDQKYYKAKSDVTNGEEDNVAGIALCGSSANQPIVVQTEGLITIGATATVGTLYYLTEAAGGICPAVDTDASGMKATMIGHGASATTIKIWIIATDATIAA